MMKEKLKASMKEAMRAKDKLRLETIRSLLSAIQYEEMNSKGSELSNEREISVVTSELKKQEEAKTFAEKDGREDIAAELDARIAVIQEFLPQQLSEPELEKIISDYASKNPDANIGGIMQHLKANHSGQYDGKTASQIAKRVSS